ncbi:hypothetical protein ACFW1M_37360, partial [Streptomyces inhibens]
TARKDAPITWGMRFRMFVAMMPAPEWMDRGHLQGGRSAMTEVLVRRDPRVTPLMTRGLCTARGLPQPPPVVEPVDVVPVVPPVVEPVDVAPPLIVVTAVRPPSSGTPFVLPPPLIVVTAVKPPSSGTPFVLPPPLIVVTAVKPPSSGTPVRPLVVVVLVVVAAPDPPPGSLHPGGEVTTLPFMTRVWQITSGADDVAFALGPVSALIALIAPTAPVSVTARKDAPIT